MKENNSMKIFLAQTNPKVGDLKKNIENHIEIISAAKDKEANLVIFPELSLTGYFLKDSVYDMGINIYTDESAVLRDIYKITKDLDISVIAGFVEKDPDFNFYNSTFCISKGGLINVHRKVYLPTYGMFEELRYFKPGNVFGVFDLDGVKVSVLTCEDAWHLSSSYIAVNKGAHIIIINSASPARGITAGLNKFNSMNMWEELLSVIAFYYKSYVLYVNRVGFEDGIGFSGGSCIFNPSGEMESKLDYLEEGEILTEINLDLLNNERFKTPLIRDENLNLTLKEIEGIINPK
ncbi:MAG: nitrilase-related carbon-nitrogen hydrolase [bacterium]|jgi:predicted amidohydrolase